MTAMNAMDPAMVEALRDLLAEGPEHIEAMERELLAALGQGRCDGLSLFRAVHTMKGILGFLGFTALAELCHRAESLLEPFKLPGAPAPEAELVERLLPVVDRLRDQLDLVAEHLASGSVPMLDGLGLLQDEPASPQAAAPVAAARQELAVRVAVPKMDALMDAVGELTVAQSQLEAGLAAGRDATWLAAQSQRLGAVAKRLQGATLRLRMVPVEPLFLRVSRQAYELARRLGKAVKVDLAGLGTEVDRGMAEELAEPMLHLVRNALDHGLEDADGRARAGKPAEGRLSLSAAHQGGEFVVTLEDDGRGLDLARLRARAQALGWLGPDEPAGAERLQAMIFEPGFSTAEAITDVSGRGVGLEAVRMRVQGLKGRVEVQSLPEHGCRFTLRLPLTLALMDAIVVRAGEQRYLLPASQVLRFVDGARCEAHSAAGSPAWVEAGASLGLLDLRRDAGTGVLLQVSQSGRQAALLVDEVLGKQQAVAKGLGPLLKDAGPYAGGAVLGDGAVGLILDLDALLGRQGAVERILTRS